MTKALYVDVDGLDEWIEKSGFKIGYLAEALGLSREGFLKKRKGEIPFRKLEKDALVSILGIPDDMKDEIFLT